MLDIYTIDRRALNEALEKKGWSPEMLATFSGVHPRTVLRILGLSYPKSMKPERRDVARQPIICRLSKTLRIMPQVIAPDLPELSPSPNSPEPPSVLGRPASKVPGDHREHWTAREFRRKKRVLEDTEIDEVA